MTMATEPNSSANASLAALTQYGVSEELMGVFQGLRETPGLNGYKFHTEDIHGLARSLLCRNYGKSCLVLCYLLWAVIKRSGDGVRHSPLLDFFWLYELISPQRFRQAFAAPLSGPGYQVSLIEGQLELQLDGGQFTLSPNRVRYLTALLEFLVHIDPAIIARAEQLKTTADIKALASELQAGIYHYLAEHISAAQPQRRFRFLYTWLEQQLEKQQTSHIETAINDELILQFWCEMAVSADDKLGFRRFRTVAENFYNIVVALQAGRAQLNNANPTAIGTCVEKGELHPDIIEQNVFQDEMLQETTDWDNLKQLAQAPKFLTKQQIEVLQPIVYPNAIRFPLTVLRAAVFGAWQAELVQALRNKREDSLRLLLEGETVTNYRHHLDALNRLDDKVRQSQLSSLHILLELKDEVIFYLPELLPKVLWVEITQWLVRDSAPRGPEPDAEELNAKLLAELSTLSLQVSSFNHFCRETAQAFKANKREGFKSLPQRCELDSYHWGMQTLLKIRPALQRYLRAVEKTLQSEAQVDNKYVADMFIFKGVFETIYGASQ